MKRGNFLRDLRDTEGPRHKDTDWEGRKKHQSGRTTSVRRCNVPIIFSFYLFSDYNIIVSLTFLSQALPFTHASPFSNSWHSLIASVNIYACVYIHIFPDVTCSVWTMLYCTHILLKVEPLLWFPDHSKFYWSSFIIQTNQGTEIWDGDGSYSGLWKMS